MCIESIFKVSHQLFIDRYDCISIDFSDAIGRKVMVQPNSLYWHKLIQWNVCAKSKSLPPLPMLG